MKNNLKAPTCQQVIDSFSEPFVIIDDNYQIISANRRYIDRYAEGSENIVGQKCHQVSHHSDRPCSEHGEHCPLEALFLTREPVQVMHVHPMPNGSEERVQINATPLFDEYGNLQYMGESLSAVPKVDLEELIIGRSSAMLQMIGHLHRVASTKTTALLLGESGVGKECAAQYIHRHSPRSGKEMVVVDCGNLSAQLIESELFGHEKGAFTGAAGRKTGLFERADGGTLFIDEVGELPLELQTKLLRVLETGMIRRIGGTEYHRVDVRIVAATNKDPQDMVAKGLFREDLYYRLSAFPIRVPALRERKDDIPDLAEFFLARMEQGEQHLPLSPKLIAALLEYDYPGNVRELRNILERAVILSAGEILTPQYLVFENDFSTPPAFGNLEADAGLSVQLPAEGGVDRLLRRRGSRPDKNTLLHALSENNGHRGRAAEQLGISERTLYRLIKDIRNQEKK